MEKIKVISVADERIIHKIYCDECKTHLGDSEEYDDGWYTPLGQYEREFYMPKHGWSYLRKTLCQHCQEEMDKKIINALTELGFRKERD